MIDLSKVCKGIGLFALIGFVWFMGFSFAMTGQGYDDCTIQTAFNQELRPACNGLEIHMAVEIVLFLISAVSIIVIALWRKK